MQDQQRYKIAIIPPAAISDEIEKIRQACAAKFFGAPVIPDEPCVNLSHPFDSDEKSIAALCSVFGAITRSSTPFIVETGYFQISNDDRVVYLDIIKSPDLAALVESFRQFLPTQSDSGYRVEMDYHPHIQIARFADHPELFREVESTCGQRPKQLHLQFECSTIHLLHYVGRTWTPWCMFHLGGKS